MVRPVRFRAPAVAGVLAAALLAPATPALAASSDPTRTSPAAPAAGRLCAWEVTADAVRVRTQPGASATRNVVEFVDHGTVLASLHRAQCSVTGGGSYTGCGRSADTEWAQVLRDGKLRYVARACVREYYY